MYSKNLLVTGGAGFIGSSLVEYLLQKDYHIIVLDNFSSGNKLSGIKSTGLEIFKGDCSSSLDLEKLPKNIDTIFHLAADPEVRLNITDPYSIFKNNIQSTFTLLEWAKNIDVKNFIFTSSSTVYGEAEKIPTPETFPCKPISIYGASKLACESLLSGYCNTFKIHGVSIRMANVIGPRSTHGILYDMFEKLKIDPTNLEILGDGTQKKSYLHVDDCVQGFFKIFQQMNSIYEVYNLGSNTQINVEKIINLILEKLNFLETKKHYTGGIDGGRGWAGDVKNMLLDISKISKYGWKPNFNSMEAIEKTIDVMKKDF